MRSKLLINCQDQSHLLGHCVGWPNRWMTVRVTYSKEVQAPSHNKTDRLPFQGIITTPETRPNVKQELHLFDEQVFQLNRVNLAMDMNGLSPPPIFTKRLRENITIRGSPKFCNLQISQISKPP